jgi:UDP-glucose 4-epimerase
VADSYLVTGGSGFIGSHLVDSLLTRGHRVTALDVLSTGRAANLDAARTHPRFRFVQGSVLDELVVDELVHDCDVVIHMAAAVGVKLIVEQLLRSITTNIRGSEIVIEAAHRYRRTILLASTSEIYGKNGQGPLHESSDRILGAPTVARWAYSTAKGVDEVLAHAYHVERGLPTIVVRLFNTVGPRQSPAYGMVVPRLVRQALAGEPLTIFGDGTQTRCFCHVTDVVEAVVGLLDHEGAIGEVFNVGSSEEVSILELANRIRSRAGSDSPLQFIPYDQAYERGFEDMARRVPNTEKLCRLTGWAPSHTLEEVLDEAIAEADLERAQAVRSPAGASSVRRSVGSFEERGGLLGNAHR